MIARVPRVNRSRGFTLIEIMVVVAIFAMVTTLLWTFFKSTFRTRAEVEGQAERYRTVRISLERMVREISMSFLSQNEDTSQVERRTFFVGKRKTGIDELRFSTFAHQELYRDSHESDTSQVAYFAARDRNDPSKTNLARRETRRLSNVKLEQASGQTDVVCENVTGLRFDYYDARDKIWRTDWSTVLSDGQPDRLPSRVRITLTVRDEREKDVAFRTEAKIAMAEPLNLRALDPQTPATTPAGSVKPATTPSTTVK